MQMQIQIQIRDVLDLSDDDQEALYPWFKIFKAYLSEGILRIIVMMVMIWVFFSSSSNIAITYETTWINFWLSILPFEWIEVYIQLGN